MDSIEKMEVIKQILIQKKYFVTEEGRVYSSNPVRYMIIHELKQYVRENQLFIVLSDNGVDKHIAVHRLVYLAHNMEWNGQEHVHHKDFNPRNNHINNLVLMNSSDHARLHALAENLLESTLEKRIEAASEDKNPMSKKSREYRLRRQVLMTGEQNPSYLHKPDWIEEVKRLKAEGYSMRRISAMLKINRSTISLALKRYDS